MADNGAPLGSTSSPRRTLEPVVQRSPLSETSNPPEELLDVYRRIEEDGTIADFVPSYDDWDAQIGSRPGSRLSRASSRAKREREHDTGSHDGHTFSEASFLDGTGSHSPRTARRSTDYTRDEQRLRRVTGKDSPIFSKAKVGARSALTADNLQRREEQEEYKALEQHVSEDDGERGLSLNLPRTWGSRARRPEWLRNVSGSSASDTQERKEENEDISHAPDSKVRTEDSTTSKPIRSYRATERSSIPVRNALGERNANPHVQETQQTELEKTSGSDQHAPPSDGAAIPNTPIVVFKNSNLTRPNTAKRDSQDLLRKLSRTESPKLVDSVKTPDPPKLFERKIYDKTPRVTGAWIDTPMTERVTELPSDLTKDIVPPPPATKEAEESSKETKTLADVKSKNESSEPVQITATESLPESQPTKGSRPPLIRPKLPKSALETVIEDVKSGKEPLDLGDDTIESLHAIMDDPVELKTEEEEEAAYAQEILNRLEQAKAGDASSVDLDRLNDKLQSLAQNINAVKKGLNSLEDVVRDVSISPKSGSPQQNEFPKLQLSEIATRSDGRLYAAIPLPRLWKRNPVSGHFQLTKLGCFTFVSLTWYIIECVMCEKYCHPIISETCDGYCLQPDAPVFPWVTVTMLWRWSHLSTILAPVITIGVAFFRLMAQLLGLWDGYVDEGPTSHLENIIGEIRVNGTPVSFPWLSPPPAKSAMPSPPQQPQQPVWTPRNEVPGRWEEDQASMDDDEYL